MKELYNARGTRIWNCIRDFLAVHYRFNTRVDNPFWRECREKTDLGASEEVVEYYQDNGPSGLWRVPLFHKTEYNYFGMEGYFAMLVGMKVPYKRTFQATRDESQFWKKVQQEFKSRAQQAYSVKEALELVRAPQWEWPGEIFKYPPGIGLRR